jgi:hypothetical protein
MASPFAVPPLRRRAAVLAAWETITDVIADEGARARAVTRKRRRRRRARDVSDVSKATSRAWTDGRCGATNRTGVDA